MWMLWGKTVIDKHRLAACLKAVFSAYVIVVIPSTKNKSATVNIYKAGRRFCKPVRLIHKYLEFTAVISLNHLACDKDFFILKYSLGWLEHRAHPSSKPRTPYGIIEVRLRCKFFLYGIFHFYTSMSSYSLEPNPSSDAASIV